jgi:hypothetical protein
MLSSALIAQNPPKPNLSTTDSSNAGSIVPIDSIKPTQSSAYNSDKFHIIEGDDVKVYLDRLESREGKAPAGIPDDEPMEAGASGTAAATEASQPAAGAGDGTGPAGGSGSMETD